LIAPWQEKMCRESCDATKRPIEREHVKQTKLGG
jgi:hypothetical protein